MMASFKNFLPPFEKIMKSVVESFSYLLFILIFELKKIDRNLDMAFTNSADPQISMKVRDPCTTTQDISFDIHHPSCLRVTPFCIYPRIERSRPLNIVDDRPFDRFQGFRSVLLAMHATRVFTGQRTKSVLLI